MWNGIIEEILVISYAGSKWVLAGWCLGSILLLYMHYGMERAVGCCFWVVQARDKYSLVHQNIKRMHCMALWTVLLPCGLQGCWSSNTGKFWLQLLMTMCTRSTCDWIDETYLSIIYRDGAFFLYRFNENCLLLDRNGLVSGFEGFVTMCSVVRSEPKKRLHLVVFSDISVYMGTMEGITEG